ncbi:CRISPR-associated protein, Csh1 family [Persephonella hydrogeniphila]|uniref:CRISPR-associated protein, Csh1 family n=1 Tax=Persephonella hydrogeniphila TaxID=198703 RepID=A0A285NSJ1_9AQUI|nr:TIGR02556 family CRISPR-associated protein [Persephonella hydrogeniphila]SNZ10641.1 CRISPR-associated protein, Csh1 family [Persephonella hydrogeniphila]
MLTAIKDIGEILLEKEKKDKIDILLENPDSNGSYKIVWVLEFDKDFNFQKISVEEFKGEKPYIYLYKRASGSNAPDFSPTSRITEPEKTFTKKLLKWLENHKDTPQIDKIYTELTNNKEKIIKKLEDLNKQTKDNKILTIKVDGKYLYEIKNPDFKQILLEDYLKKIKEISKKDGVCSICGEKKEEVFTTSQIYKFYTLDKECYITGGFNKKNAWKNFPICEECFLKIDYGKKFIENNLNFKFYGKNYYLIPKLILNIPEALEEINEILSTQNKKVDLTQKRRITDDKEEILDLLKDYKDVISFYFLFLKKENAAEKILLLVEDVFPSRIHRIFDTKEQIDKLFNQDYNFGRLVKFLNEFDKFFFEVVDKIFRGGSLQFSTVLQIFNRKIQNEFINSKDYKKTTLDALMNIKFFEELGLINFEVKDMENSKFDEIYEKIGKSLNTPAKRGIFLLGALTQMLLNIQGQERNSTPFFKNLKGLKMNEEDIKGLLPKVINKLIEYDRFDKGKKELSEEIAKNLLSQEKFGLTIDEINFYFASGMALSGEVASILYEKGAKENETKSQTV